MVTVNLHSRSGRVYLGKMEEEQALELVKKWTGYLNNYDEEQDVVVLAIKTSSGHIYGFVHLTDIEAITYSTNDQNVPD